jgi:DNA helicase HerA-like ATPase
MSATRSDPPPWEILEVDPPAASAGARLSESFWARPITPRPAGANGTVELPERPAEALLGYSDWDRTGAISERILLRAPAEFRHRVQRNQFVCIADGGSRPTLFLGRVVAGPFFPGLDQDSAGPDQRTVLADVEVLGELVNGRPRDTHGRPAPGSAVYALTVDEIRSLTGVAGDMLFGSLAGRDDINVLLDSNHKDVLPRNVGIFGTVGSGKSNTTQVLIEEASATGWSVIVLDVEGEYTEMDAPSDEEKLHPKLARFGRQPVGLPDFKVLYPASCASDRADSQPFNLRLADFETPVIAEILQTTLAERNALLEIVDHFEQRARARMFSNEKDRLYTLLDPSSQAKLPFSLGQLRERANERAPRTSDFVDFQGLSTKLQWLIHAGAFDQPGMNALDPAGMLQPGRVTVLDVAIANDVVKNLVTADLLRKIFAYKILHAEAPRTLLVIEEAHSFISREKVQTMHATLQMLRAVTRRGRKRWLSVAFVSQQPGHLPPEIFELCNTRIVHTLHSTHNLESLMATTGDMTRELWARCPLLGTGEAIFSSPQLRRPLTVHVRPASSQRRFVR